MKDKNFKKAYMDIIIKQSWTGAIGGAVLGGAAGGIPGAVGGALVGSQLGNEEDETITVNAMDDTAVAEDTPAAVKVVTFKTSNPDLIAALENGFAKVTITGLEEDATPVDFDKDAFEDFAIVDDEEVATEEGETVEECGDSQAEGDVATEEEGDDVATEEEGDDVATEEDEAAADDNTVNEDDEIDPSEWLEDGVCVKCGEEACDGSCKCKKCGSVNCIGDCK